MYLPSSLLDIFAMIQCESTSYMVMGAGTAVALIGAVL